jgi:hypothetical protein
MSAIAMEFFRQSPVAFMPLVALVIFMVVFLTVTVRAFIKHSASWEEVSRLPLEGDTSRGQEGRDE